MRSTVTTGGGDHSLRLPRGRHNLPRNFVVENQRQRMLAAVAERCSRDGYAKMSVEDIIKVAGVSRRTFYDTFKNKNEAFLAAYDAISVQLLEQVQVPVLNAVETGELRRGVRDALKVFLEFVASEPRFAKMCFIDAYAAGPEALQRRSAVLSALAGFIRMIAMEIDRDPPTPPQMAELVAGGIYSILHQYIANDKVAELPALLPDIVFFVDAPYFGLDAAHQERALSR